MYELWDGCMKQNGHIWIYGLFAIVLIRGEFERKGKREWKVCVWVCVLCLQQWCSRAEWQWRGEKENMIEWDILSAADVSWSLDWACVCVYRGIPKSESPWTYSLLLYWHSKAATSLLTWAVPQLLIGLPLPMSLLIVCVGMWESVCLCLNLATFGDMFWI